MANNLKNTYMNSKIKQSTQQNEFEVCLEQIAQEHQQIKDVLRINQEQKYMQEAE